MRIVIPPVDFVTVRTDRAPEPSMPCPVEGAALRTPDFVSRAWGASTAGSVFTEGSSKERVDAGATAALSASMVRSGCLLMRALTVFTALLAEDPVEETRLLEPLRPNDTRTPRPKPDARRVVRGARESINRASRKNTAQQASEMTASSMASPHPMCAIEKKSGNPMMPVASPPMMEAKSKARTIVNGCEIRQMRQHPTLAVETRHIVESVETSKASSELASMHRQAPTITETDAGNARLTTLTRKLPSTRARLASSPSTKPG